MLLFLNHPVEIEVQEGWLTKHGTLDTVKSESQPKWRLKQELDETKSRLK